MRTTTALVSGLGISTTCVLALVLLAPGPRVLAQSWEDGRSAIDGCERELGFRMSRETPGREPSVGLDRRGLDVQSRDRNTIAVRGKGTFRRDQFDRGRTYTFECTYIVRDDRATVSYRWDGSFSADYDEPAYSRPPSYRPPTGGYGSGGSYPSSGRVYFSGGIINRASGKGLDVQNEGRGDAANIQQWDFGGKPNQTWDVVDLGRGEFSIVNQGSGKALDVANHEGADGANVQQFRWHNGDNQRWRLERVGGGYYQIVSVSSGRCLDVNSAQLSENGGNVQQWSCSGQANQQWQLRR